MVGRTLGSYTIVEHIGAGGMGEVYLATHRRIERKAAIKLLLPALSRDADIVNRFFDEARATSLITHPGIVQIYDCDVFEDRAYIVMEYLEGANLSTVLARNGAFDIGTAVWVAANIAGALAAAHAKRIVHRDLKPENVFLAHDPLRPGATVVKILDFGIAKLSDRTGPASHTRTGSILGTPLYMSPEQCRGITNIDHRADIYALGGILFELLTGRPPFVKEAPGDLLVAHVSEAPPLPSSLTPAVPPELDRLVTRMLAKSPGDRPPTMDAVARELAPFRSGGDPAAAPALTLKLDPPAAEAAPSPSPSAGGTRLLPDQPAGNGRSTLGMSAAEAMPGGPRPRRRAVLWLTAGGLAAAGVAFAIFRGDPRLHPAAAMRAVDRQPLTQQPVPPPRHAAVGVPSTTPPPEPATVTIDVQSQPSGASVWLGDAAEPRGRTPLRLALPRSPTPVHATLKADGYADGTITFGVDRDQTIELALQPVEARHHPARPTASTHGGHRAAHPTASRAAALTDTPKPPPPKTEPQKKYYMLGD